MQSSALVSMDAKSKTSCDDGPQFYTRTLRRTTEKWKLKIHHTPSHEILAILVEKQGSSQNTHKGLSFDFFYSICLRDFTRHRSLGETRRHGGSFFIKRWYSIRFCAISCRVSLISRSWKLNWYPWLKFQATFIVSCVQESRGLPTLRLSTVLGINDLV